MRAQTWPPQRGRRDRNGTGRRAAAIGEIIYPEPHRTFDRRFDRMMNWIVGALLLAATAGLVVLQARPPV